MNLATLRKNISRFTNRIWRELDYNLVCLHRTDVFLKKHGTQIGRGCDIAVHPDSFGSEPYLIRIGNAVTITVGVRFITHDGSTRLFRQRFPAMNKYGNVFAPIIVGDNCFIGNNAILLPGTQIGPNSIVGAGAVVKGSFPAESVIAGVPARQISTLGDYIAKVQQNMLTLKAQTREELRAELIAHFFGQPDPASNE